MSKRIWIGLMLCMGTAVAHAELSRDVPQPEMRLGDSSWYLYRPEARSPEIYDIDYLTDRLRCELPGYALRFTDSVDFAFELRFAPLLDQDDFIGPVYDMDIGATQLVFSISF